jgi:hypothetical protein
MICLGLRMREIFCVAQKTEVKVYEVMSHLLQETMGLL